MNQPYLCLHYSALIAEYDRRLEEIERGFGMEAEFLRTWVPDDDPNKSLLYLFEAAAKNNLPGLEVVLDSTHLGSIDSPGLLHALKSLGGVNAVREEGRVTLKVAFESTESSADGFDEVPGLSSIHRAYRDRLVRESRNPRHRIEPGTTSDSEQRMRAYSEAIEECSLTVVVDPRDHVVRVMRYTASNDGVRVRLLEMLSRLMEGEPFQEVAEHGVIRLENSLRDALMPPPVRGLISPETAGPHFAEINRAIRRVFRRYLEEVSGVPQRNTSEFGVSEAWSALSQGEKIERIRVGVAGCPSLEGIAVQVTKLVDTQAYVTLEACPTERRRREVIRLLERHLKATVESKLEVYLPTVPDKLKRDVDNQLMGTDRGGSR